MAFAEIKLEYKNLLLFEKSMNAILPHVRMEQSVMTCSTSTTVRVQLASLGIIAKLVRNGVNWDIYVANVEYPQFKK